LIRKAIASANEKRKTKKALKNAMICQSRLSPIAEICPSAKVKLPIIVKAIHPLTIHKYGIKADRFIRYRHFVLLKLMR
jgi:hypothetical protein